MQNPAFYISLGDCHPPTVIRFCPLFFKRDTTTSETPMIDIPYKFVFAVLTLTQVFIYSTESIKPLACISNIHYDSLTDASWN